MREWLQARPARLTAKEVNILEHFIQIGATVHWAETVGEGTERHPRPQLHYLCLTYALRCIFLAMGSHRMVGVGGTGDVYNQR